MKKQEVELVLKNIIKYNTLVSNRALKPKVRYSKNISAYTAMIPTYKLLREFNKIIKKKQ